WRWTLSKYLTALGKTFSEENIKKLVKILLWTLVALLLALAGFIYALQYRPVQTYFAKRAADYLSRELHTSVSLEGLYFKPFSSLVLRGLYVADLSGDTLLYADQLTASVNLWKIREHQITISKLALTGGSFFVHRQGDNSNLSFLIDYFLPDTNKKSLVIGGVSRLMSAPLTYPISPSATCVAWMAQLWASITEI